MFVFFETLRVKKKYPALLNSAGQHTPTTNFVEELF